MKSFRKSVTAGGSMGRGKDGKAGRGGVKDPVGKPRAGKAMVGARATGKGKTTAGARNAGKGKATVGARTAGGRKYRARAGNRELEYISKLKAFFSNNKRMPSYGELAGLMQAKSKFAAQYWVTKWLEEGLIKNDDAGKLLPGKIFYPVKVLGTVQAGFPSPAEEENVDTISLDDWLIENRESSFMLKVTGDSMIEAGIMPGDMVIINRGKQPKSGDIVIAEVDGKWTIKFFIRGTGGGRVVLKAANKKYPPIVPKEELRVAGVVTCVIRKY